MSMWMNSRRPSSYVSNNWQSYPGLFDIADDSQPGKWEFQLQVKEESALDGYPDVPIS